MNIDELYFVDHLFLTGRVYCICLETNSSFCCRSSASVPEQLRLPPTPLDCSSAAGLDCGVSEFVSGERALCCLSPLFSPLFPLHKHTHLLTHLRVCVCVYVSLLALALALALSTPRICPFSWMVYCAQVPASLRGVSILFLFPFSVLFLFFLCVCCALLDCAFTSSPRARRLSSLLARKVGWNRETAPRRSSLSSTVQSRHCHHLIFSSFPCHFSSQIRLWITCSPLPYPLLLTDQVATTSTINNSSSPGRPLHVLLLHLTTHICSTTTSAPTLSLHSLSIRSFCRPS